MMKPKKSKAKSPISQYLSEIGRRGGRNGKGSAARREAARKGAAARWAKHQKPTNN